MLSFLHSPSLLSSSLTPLFESVYHFYLSIHPPFLHPFLSRHINIHQSFHLSTLHLLFSAQFVRAIHSSLLLSSLLPGTCPHAFQLDPSFLSTFLISSSFLYTFYTSLHLNPSWWSLPLHPPSILLSVLCWCTDCQLSTFCRQLAQKLLLATFLFFCTVNGNLTQETLGNVRFYWIRTNLNPWGQAQCQLGVMKLEMQDAQF